MSRIFARGSKGFTLIELMIVVAILAILAAIATVSFRKYAQRAKVTEAFNMLGMIRMRQESYRSEFSQFCDVSSSSQNGTTGDGMGNTWPMSAPSRNPVDWGTGLPANSGWRQLGVQPTSAVYFRYDTEAGNPGVAPAFFPLAVGGDTWWAAHAFGNLDGVGAVSTFETFSGNGGVWIRNDESD